MDTQGKDCGVTVEQFMGANQVLMARATSPRPTFAHVISPSKRT